MKTETLVQALKNSSVGTNAIRYIHTENREHIVNYAQLWERASKILHYLHTSGVRQGDELILYLDNLCYFVDVFWAAILGGIIPVPLAVGTSELHRRKLLKVFAQLHKPFLLTSDDELEALNQFANNQGLEQDLLRIKDKTLSIQRALDNEIHAELAEVSPDDVAFIQFSSGSTGDPKGVLLTHRNVLSNIHSILAKSEMGSHDRFLSWMPLTHDMGLIGFHLTPLVAEINQYLMPTSLFVRRPMVWLKKISNNMATIISSPNFGYQHVLSRIYVSGEVDLDLSSVRLIFNGAEPISANLCRQFIDTMRPLGLSDRAMYPVYGLAEASLAVTFPEPGQKLTTTYVARASLKIGEKPVCRCAPGTDTGEMVAVGSAISGTEIRIADNDADPLPQGYLGHILIRGANVTDGYYGAEAPNGSVFKSGGWLDTGDLGFFENGQLYIAGRAKELIIVNGINYHPLDLESICLAVEGVETGKVVACSLMNRDDEMEGLVIFVLFRGAIGEFVGKVSEIKRLVQEHAGVEVSEVIPVGKIPKTTSGKVSRFELAQQYINGEFLPIQQEIKALNNGPRDQHDGNEVECILLDICNSVVTDREVGMHDNLFEVGASSLKLAQIQELIDQKYPDRLEMTDLFDYPTVSQLAGYLETKPAH